MMGIKPEERVYGVPSIMGRYAEARLDQMEEENPELVKALARAGYLSPYLKLFEKSVEKRYAQLTNLNDPHNLYQAYGVNQDLQSRDWMAWEKGLKTVDAMAFDMALREMLETPFPPMPTKEEQEYLFKSK